MVDLRLLSFHRCGNCSLCSTGMLLDTNSGTSSSSSMLWGTSCYTGRNASCVVPWFYLHIKNFSIY